MGIFKYRVIQTSVDEVGNVYTFPDETSKTVEKFIIDSFFQEEKHRIEVDIYSLNGEFLQTVYEYNNLIRIPQQDSNGAHILSIDPSVDATTYGYYSGDVTLIYKFLNDLFSETGRGELFIEQISADRREFRALSTKITSSNLVRYVNQIKARLNTGPYYYEFKVNLGNSQSITAVNIDIQDTEKGQAVIFKLYDPLPDNIGVNKQFYVEEEVADPTAFNVFAEFEEDLEPVVYVKGPNFNVDVVDDNDNPSEYLNYEDLLSYEISNPYYELRSLAEQKGANLSIDFTEFSNFIHFSSAEERLKNFKYKLTLLQGYEDKITTIKAGTVENTTASTSVLYYENLIKGLLRNLDGYERHLYFESGSTCWPKTNTVKPYINSRVDSVESTAWYNTQILLASSYDEQNLELLSNTIPKFIREDSINEPYVVFTHMVGQHFDNIWIYSKSISDRYNADNRLDFGIPKDLVRLAIEGMGVKLYNSPQNINNLFAVFSGESHPDSGSLGTTSYVVATSGSLNSNLQPVPKIDYQREIYKRIYHNLPLLLKSKGTERGLRVLLNCYGIPSEILQVKQFGGADTESNIYISPNSYTTSSLSKVRTQNTGSVAEGNTLSGYTTIVKPSQRFSDDLHNVEVGFNLSTLADQEIRASLSSPFSIDDYIGDPRDSSKSTYPELNFILKDIETSNPVKGIVRLLKYFDNSVFRMIKDFIPARTNLTTGVIVKSPELIRSKHKQVALSVESDLVEGTLDLISVEGGDGGGFLNLNSTDYSSGINTPAGPVLKIISNESPKYTGELGGSTLVATTGELNEGNIYKHYTTSSLPLHSDYNIREGNVQDNRLSRLSLENLPSTAPETKAQFQDNLNTAIGLSNARYKGTRASSYAVNNSINAVNTYGGNPPVESLSTYMGYVSEIEDPYPLVNNVTYFKVQYLVDGDGNVQDPKLSDYVFSDLKENFTNREFIRSNLKIPREQPQFINLNGIQTLKHVGKKATPILYSQTSSNGYAFSIPLMYSLDNLELQPEESILYNLGVSATGTLPIPVNFSQNMLNYIDAPFTDNRIYVDSRIIDESDGDILKGDSNTVTMPTGSNYFPEYELLYSYKIMVNNFNNNSITTGTAGDITLSRFIGVVSTPGGPIILPPIPQSFVDIQATVTTYTTSSTHVENGQTYPYVGVFGAQTDEGSYTRFPLKRGHLKGFLSYRFGGDTAKFGEISHFLIEIQARGVVKLGKYYYNELQVSSSVGTSPVVFNPSTSTVPTPASTIQISNLLSTSSITPLGEKYWEYLPGYTNQIYLNSSIASLTYGSGYSQDGLIYIPGPSSRFPTRVEPENTFIAKPRLPWSLQVGDEIRFENSESYTYTITGINPTYEIIEREYRVVVAVNKSIPTYVNKNIFLIRRYEEDRNNLIVYKTFPYSNSITIMSDGPSTTGFILPMYPSEQLKNNPDRIIKELIDKKIIE